MHSEYIPAFIITTLKTVIVEGIEESDKELSLKKDIGWVTDCLVGHYTA